jgi:1,4-dihydroxy-2-naphthoate octaprenyltransferase
MIRIKPWIKAARLRTLPLTLSGIFLGSMVACSQGRFDFFIFLLGFVTATLLQILSNYANDYGDFVSGADEKRHSLYERALQSGAISPKSMRRMLVVLSFLIGLSGISLIAVAAGTLGVTGIVAFLVMGVLCILAAITYTIGKKPYGYLGLGDMAVFIFFGLVGVGGIYILHTGQWDWSVLIPASSMGFLSVGVLNINNIRDFESDRLSGKNTLVVRMGLPRARKYYACIIFMAVVSGVVYSLLNDHGAFQWIYLVTFPFFFRNMRRVQTSTSSTVFDHELKNLSLITCLYAITFGVGLIL